MKDMVSSRKMGGWSPLGMAAGVAASGAEDSAIPSTADLAAAAVAVGLDASGAASGVLPSKSFGGEDFFLGVNQKSVTQENSNKQQAIGNKQESLTLRFRLIACRLLLVALFHSTNMQSP
jgi:hypothetical protein